MATYTLTSLLIRLNYVGDWISVPLVTADMICRFLTYFKKVFRIDSRLKTKLDILILSKDK